MERVVPAVAFFGRARSGKTTAARLLAARGWAIVSLAGPIKQMLSTLPDVTEDHLTGERKEEPIPLYGQSARQMLQTLGTEWRDHVRPDLWLRLWDREAERLARYGQPAVCDDGRFPHEVEYLRGRGVRCVLLRRPSADARQVTHASEALLDADCRYDAIIANDGTREDLEARVVHALESLGVTPQRWVPRQAVWA